MAELKYDSKTGRLLFTKEMEKGIHNPYAEYGTYSFQYTFRMFLTTTATSRNFSTLAALKLHRQVLNMFITTPVTLHSL